MPAAEPVPQKAGPCPFGAARLLPILDILSAECAGIRANNDTEHVHKARVTSRRLRAALPHFASCFEEKEYSRWMQEIKRITRALGAARDLDVQIAFLKKYIKTCETRKGDPLVTLLSGLQKKRGELQDQVCRVLDQLEESQVISAMQAACRSSIASQKQQRRYCSGILAVSGDRIGTRIAGIGRYAAFVQNPDAAYEHHALRIALKKLRYTLEVYAPLYRRGFEKPVTRIKKLQDLLGGMHDCDVWIDQMARMIGRQRSRPHPKKALPGAAVSAVAPYRQLLMNRERERARLYRQFLRTWNTLERTGFWRDLVRTVREEQKKAFDGGRHAPEKKEREAFTALAATVPGHADHEMTTEALSLALFDELASLHGLSRRDRTLLSYAALVHDIGWSAGQKNHRENGRNLILACPDLPVPVKEQGIIALVSGLHGGKARKGKAGFWHILLPEDQHRVLALAALLRIADGLDYSPAQNVASVKCTAGKETVTVTVTGTGDLAAQKARALKKSDLFFEVFDKTVVIP